MLAVCLYAKQESPYSKWKILKTRNRSGKGADSDGHPARGALLGHFTKKGTKTVSVAEPTQY